MKFFKIKSIVISLVFLFTSFLSVNYVLAAKWGCIKLDGNCIDIESENNETAAIDCYGQCGQFCSTSRRLGGCPPRYSYPCLIHGVCKNVEAINEDFANAECKKLCPAGDPYGILSQGASQCFISSDRRPCQVSSPTSNFACIHGILCDNIAARDYTQAILECINKFGQESEARATPCPAKGDWACFRDKKCENVQAGFYQQAQGLCPNGEVAKEKISCGQALLADPALDEKYGPLAGTSLADLQEIAAQKLNRAKTSDPKVLISRAIKLLTAFIGSIALLLYVVSGFLWMTASGSSEQVDRAKKIMVWTTLGVVVILFSYMLTTTLFDSITNIGT